MSTRIAFFGLGTMGAGMARRLLAAGLPVTVYNRTPDRAAPLGELGARITATSAEAATASRSADGDSHSTSRCSSASIAGSRSSAQATRP